MRGNSQDPVINPLVEASDKHTRLERWVSSLQQHQETFTKFKGFDDLPSPDASEITEARNRLAVLDLYASRQDALLKSIDVLQTEYDKAVAEDDALAVEKGTLKLFCPTCAQPVQTEHKHVERNVA